MAKNLQKTESKIDKKRVFCCEFSMRFENDKGEKLFDFKKFKTALNTHTTIKNYGWCIHNKDIFTQYDKDEKDEQFANVKIGEKKPKHIHCVLLFSTPIFVRNIANWFGIPKERILFQTNKEKGGKGSNYFFEKIAYLSHEFEPKEAKKYIYSWEDEVFISPNVNKKDFIEEVREYKIARQQYNENYVDETQMKFYCEKIESGSLSVDKVKRKIGSYNYTKYERYISEARQRYIRNVAPMPFPRSNFYIDAEKDNKTNSKSGMGKSVFAKCIACVLAKEFGADENMSFEDLVKNKYVYVLGDTKVKLQNYDGEPILFIDDLGNKDLKDMFGHKIIKNLFDEFPVRFDIDKKYGYCCVISKYIIINGIEDFDVFANGLLDRYKDKNGEEVNADVDTTQMFRRFIAHFKVVNENNIDIFWNKGILQRTREYKEYERDRIYFNVAESILLRKVSQLPFADRIKTKLLEYQKKVENRLLTDNEVREIIMKATNSQKALDKFNTLSKTYDEKGNEIIKVEDKEFTEYLTLKEKQRKLPLNKTEYNRFLELDKKFNLLDSDEDLPF